MKVSFVSDAGVGIALSRRNLEHLLMMLDDPGSSRTLIRRGDDRTLTIRAEPDEVHYQDREPGPGYRGASS